MNYQVCYRLRNDKSGVWFAKFYEFKVDALDEYRSRKHTKVCGDVKLLKIGDNK